MNFKLDNIRHLFNELEIAVRLAGKSTLDESGFITIKAEAETVTLAISNSGSSYVATIPAEVSEPGCRRVYCAKLAELAKKLKDGAFIFNETDGKLTVKPVNGGRSLVVSLRTISATDQNIPAIGTGDNAVAVNTGDFVDAAALCSDFISKDKARPMLAGIHIEKRAGDKLLRFSATNGKHLAHVERAFDNLAEDSVFSVILPYSAFSIIRDISDGYENCNISFADNALGVAMTNRSFLAMGLSGAFPKVDRVFRTSDTAKVLVNTNELSECLTIAATVIDSASRRLGLRFADNRIEISTEAKDGETTSQSIDAEVNAEDTAMFVNAEALAAVLSHMNAEKTAIAFSGPGLPLTIRPEAENRDYFYMVMPMTVR